jgi:hypothetical protein
MTFSVFRRQGEFFCETVRKIESGEGRNSEEEERSK